MLKRLVIVETTDISPFYPPGWAATARGLQLGMLAPVSTSLKIRPRSLLGLARLPRNPGGHRRSGARFDSRELPDRDAEHLGGFRNAVSELARWPERTAPGVERELLRGAIELRAGPIRPLLVLALLTMYSGMKFCLPYSTHYGEAL